MTQKSSPTIDDVARLAAVSTATVSRCLNAPQKVSQKTLERVMGAVRDLGYTPNFAARAMAANRTRTIGAVIPTMENAIFARGLQAFQEALHLRGYTLLVASSAYDPTREAEQIRTLVGRGADGLLLIGHDRPDATYAYLSDRDVPALVSWAYDADGALSSVGFDNRAAMRGLANHMLELGHRRIAVISGHIAGNDRAAERVGGIRDAMMACGLDAGGLPVEECDYDIDAGAAACGRLLDCDPPPTLLMCGNDVLAVGALREAGRRGLRVPDDLSITGFDDIELARIVVPPLTTVHVPHRQMGGLAAETLIGMIETGTRPDPVKLDSSLRLRGSVRAVRP
ncbi:LacI family DNA-binding transcriptional regulator [Pseudooctadecabacter sp.]|uniref:LacI family DNA-binding transcriptional regulator n=1 Tax=Pseudooctadecabacter sp. TaxID=1966338 RepID=UPI0025F4DBF1|nr:LacI family DNA-binding transcriptional regulator [Pseudooctadecabacter sp.]